MTSSGELIGLLGSFQSRVRTRYGRCKAKLSGLRDRSACTFHLQIRMSWSRHGARWLLSIQKDTRSKNPSASPAPDLRGSLRTDCTRVTGLALVMADQHESPAQTASLHSGQGSFDEKADYSHTNENPEALYAAGTLEKQASYDASSGRQLLYCLVSSLNI